MCEEDKIEGLQWHKRLGHISKSRVERLVSDGILDSLDFSDFDICRVKMILYGHFYNSKLLQANGVDPLFCLPRTCRLQQFPGGLLILV